MSLIPEFDVLPHGVVNEERGVFAVFKMIVTIQKPAADSLVNTAAWQELAHKVNGTWSWKYRSHRLTILNDNTGEPISFVLKSAQNALKYSRSFHFGEEFLQDNQFFASVVDQILTSATTFFYPGAGTENGSISAVAPSRTTQEMGFRVRNNGELLGATMLGPAPKVVYGTGYTDLLLQAETFSKSLAGTLALSGEPAITSDTQDGLNFEKIYGGLLDEPQAAEVRYGLIREFRIPIADLIVRDTEVAYSIAVPGNAGQKEFAVRRKDGKYYNGLRKLCMTVGTAATHDFHEVYVNYSDPYNNHLSSIEQRDSHPDGIYVIVRHKGTAETMVDPFERDFLRGFNVVVQSLDGNLYSLSLHNKRIDFKADRQRDRRSLEIKRTSGVLQPQADLMVSHNKGYRSNILFAWRGDNLLVNRLAPGGTDESLETYPEDKREADFLAKTCMEVSDALVAGSQTQLIATNDGSVYRFFVRTVTPAGYCIPLRTENPPEVAITMEDLDETELNLLLFTSSPFEVGEVAMVPVKTISMIGPRTYENAGTDFVDSAQHLVLNRIKRERKEVRYIFPPFIKFEDFRYQGFLTPASIRFANETTLTEGEFIRRCIRYEERAEVGDEARVMPYEARGFQSINYLADCRADHLLFVPADYATYSSFFWPKVTKSFDYAKNHPYYSDTNSCMLELVPTEPKKSELTLQKKGGTQITLFGPIPDGLYAFRVYATNTNSIPTVSEVGYFTGTNIRLSIVNKPDQPEIEPPPPANRPIIVSRLSSDPNDWWYTFRVKQLSRTWNSLKYLEKTTSLMLTHDKVLLDDLILNLKPDLRLLNDEYPYELFIVESGDKNLKDTLYPRSIKLDFKAGSALKGVSDIFLKLKLNQQSLLEVRLTEKVDIYLNSRLLRRVEYDSDQWVRIFYDFEIGGYHVIPRNASSGVKLDDPIEATITDHDVVIDDKVMTHLALDSFGFYHYVILNRSDEYIFQVTEPHANAVTKEIQLFASSIFQGYFPEVKSELELGTASRSFSLFLPNNQKPTTPVPECDILLVRRADDAWNNDNIKQNQMENIVRILLEEDFMKEGRNKLGIVLKRFSSTDAASDHPAELGEDITKLTEMDWSGFDLGDIIHFGYGDERITKYFKGNFRRFIEIEGALYQVLECEPYYNAHLRRWQILLPLQLRESETLFVKIAVVKCAPGHSLRLKNFDAPESVENPYIDFSNTCFSAVSKPVQLPVYAPKRIEVQRIRHQNAYIYRLYQRTVSRHLNKIYFVAVRDKGETVLNLASDSGERFSQFYEFTYRPSTMGNPMTGKILRTSLLNNIFISLPNTSGKSLLVMEFEIHDNAPNTIRSPELQAEVARLSPEIPRVERRPSRSTLKNSRLLKMKEKAMEELAALPTEFVNYNPLFDTKGIRLIYIAEFNF